MSDAPLAALEAFVRRHPRLFVLTGAGVSTASGIPDYRDEGGQWKRPPPMTLQAFLATEAARRRYWARSFAGWTVMGRAQPNTAHHALAQLQRQGWVAALVTQNVDGMHEAADSQGVIDLHGRIDTVVCLACGERTPRAALQERLAAANPGWVARVVAIAPDGDAELTDTDTAGFAVPPCARCGGLLKPDVVFFGEQVPRERVHQAFEALAAADAVLVVGSSLMVWSGYRFVHAAAQAGQPVAALNQGRTRADDLLALKLAAPAGAVLASLAAALAKPPVSAASS
ncbi:MAG: NAD-dependent protein deacetylase [Proteobacteria bacterium]|nr:NAD-dependent protein deacetylase [Pseudomonadota bacterium]